MSYKKILLKLGVLLGFGVILLLYTNAGVSKSSLAPFQTEAKLIDSRLTDSSLSAMTRQMYRQHRVRISNLLALKSQAKNCGDLYAVDATALTANYKLYPNGIDQQSVVVRCVNFTAIMQVIQSFILDE